MSTAAAWSRRHAPRMTATTRCPPKWQRQEHPTVQQTDLLPDAQIGMMIAQPEYVLDSKAQGEALGIEAMMIRTEIVHVVASAIEVSLYRNPDN